MLLAIDTGNTNTIFAVFDGDTKIADWRCKTISGRTADEYAVWLEPLFRHESLKFAVITDVIASSVVPDVNFDLRKLAEKYFNCPAMIVGQEIKDTGLKIALDRPEELGADRIVNSVAAISQYDLPAFIIDFGTATTFDIINENGVYCGGVIAPGVHLSMEALHMAAAQLPTVNIKKPEKVAGTNTVSALQSGLYWGYVSMIEGIIARLGREMNFQKTPAVIATGGLAALFCEDLPQVTEIDNNLTLTGLRIIYKRYQNNYINIEAV